MISTCKPNLNTFGFKFLTSLTTSESFFAFIFTGVSNMLVNALFFGLCLKKESVKGYQECTRQPIIKVLFEHSKTQYQPPPLYT